MRRKRTLLTIVGRSTAVCPRLDGSALASLYLLYRSVLLLTIVGRFPGHGRGLSALRPHSSQQAAVCRTRTSPSGRMPCRGSVHPMSLNIVRPSGVELAALQSDASGVACVCRTGEVCGSLHNTLCSQCIYTMGGSSRNGQKSSSLWALDQERRLASCDAHLRSSGCGAA